MSPRIRCLGSLVEFNNTFWEICRLNFPKRVKVKVTLEQATKTQRGSRGISTLSLTSALDAVGCHATPLLLYPRENPGTHCVGGWVGPRAGLDRCGKSRHLAVFDPRTLQPVASRFWKEYWGIILTFVQFYNRVGAYSCTRFRYHPIYFLIIRSPMHCAIVSAVSALLISVGLSHKIWVKLNADRREF
jgi:hypothetical protein